MDPFNWTCPYCDRAQTVVSENFSIDEARICNPRSTFGNITSVISSTVCANSECNRLSLNYGIWPILEDTYSDPDYSREAHESWRLLPESSAKPQPDYIPVAIREDYLQACRIASLSPKASATLARRCLQGMVRDFAGIVEKTLFQEIKKLRKEMDEGKAPKGVTFESVEAIDHVRKIGNIGAHMEEDVNLVIEIEPGEAEQLIGLIELLFKEWYVAQRERQRRLDAIKATYEAKVEAKKPKIAEPETEVEEVAAIKSEGQEGAVSGEGA